MATVTLPPPQKAFLKIKFSEFSGYLFEFFSEASFRHSNLFLLFSLKSKKNIFLSESFFTFFLSLVWEIIFFVKKDSAIKKRKKRKNGWERHFFLFFCQKEIKSLKNLWFPFKIKTKWAESSITITMNSQRNNYLSHNYFPLDSRE